MGERMAYSGCKGQRMQKRSTYKLRETSNGFNCANRRSRWLGRKMLNLSGMRDFFVMLI